MTRLTRLCLSAVLIMLAAGSLRADSPGQEDLDKATEAKLSADSSKDLGEVIRLSESALKKGLDEANTDFANRLLSATLIQRASEMSNRIGVNLTSMDELRQRRRSILADLEKAVKLDPKQPQAYLLIGQVNAMPGGDVKQGGRPSTRRWNWGSKRCRPTPRPSCCAPALKSNPRRRWRISTRPCV